MPEVINVLMLNLLGAAAGKAYVFGLASWIFLSLTLRISQFTLLVYKNNIRVQKIKV